MADALAARREIRRRKILANSGNRFQVITGKSDIECPKELLSISSVIPEPEYEVPIAASSSSYSKTLEGNGTVHSEPELFPFTTTPVRGHENYAAGDGDVTVTHDQASLLPPASEPVPSVTLWEKMTTYKYDIVLLSLVIQTLYAMSWITFDSGYFFLPVIVYIVTKLVWFPVQNTSNIANILLLLNGMSQTRVRNILYVTQCVNVVSRDMFVYLFTTICVQSLWISVRDLLVT